MNPSLSTVSLREAFQSHFGHEPECIVRAPGRVNLIGEHTDYNSGVSIPCAIDRHVWIAFASVSGPSRMVSQQDSAEVVFDVATVEPGAPIPSWGRYPAGMAWALREAGMPVKDIEAYVVGDVPLSAGLSSSAAIEMAFALAWAPEMPPLERAKLGQICENRFVGAQTGLMDQATSALGEKDHALFADFRDHTFHPIPMPPNWSIVVCNTNVKHDHVEGEYNTRRAQCEEACRELGVSSLREATLDFVDNLHGVLRLRANHVVREIERCFQFAEALQHEDSDRAGLLMHASHESLRLDYEVTCRELDIMAELAWDMPETIGCRMTGGGFGGACVALVPAISARSFVDDLAPRYEERAGIAGQFLICYASDGASVVQTV